MKVLQFLISAGVGVALCGVAISQTSQSTSQSHSGNGTNSASASSSAQSSGFGRQSGSYSGQGSGSSIRIPKPTHAILFTPTSAWTQLAYDRIKPARAAYFSKLQQAAQLIYFGPWRESPGEMSVVVCSDQSARLIADNDPAIQAGLETAEVRSWDVQVEPYSPASNTVGSSKR